MPTIEVDFEVYKQLTVRRATEDVSYNDVIRDLLGMKGGTVAPTSQASDWVTKGARFPSGTDFRAVYKGETYTAKVVDGKFVAATGISFGTLSAAAVAVTGNPVNGWRFWECRLPGSSKWVSADVRRQK